MSVVWLCVCVLCAYCVCIVRIVWLRLCAYCMRRCRSFSNTSVSCVCVCRSVCVCIYAGMPVFGLCACVRGCIAVCVSACVCACVYVRMCVSLTSPLRSALPPPQESEPHSDARGVRAHHTDLPRRPEKGSRRRTAYILWLSVSCVCVVCVYRVCVACARVVRVCCVRVPYGVCVCRVRVVCARVL